MLNPQRNKHKIAKRKELGDWLLHGALIAMMAGLLIVIFTCNGKASL